MFREQDRPELARFVAASLEESGYGSKTYSSDISGIFPISSSVLDKTAKTSEISHENGKSAAPINSETPAIDPDVPEQVREMPRIKIKWMRGLTLTEEQREANFDFYQAVAHDYALQRAWTEQNERQIRHNLHDIFLPMMRPLQEQLAAQGQRARVLIIGTGTGRDQQLLESAGFECYGVDISQNMIHEASDRFDSNFAVAEAGALPFVDNAFHAVYVDASAEHMDARELEEQVLPEITRVIMPNSELEANLMLNYRLGDGKVVEVTDMGRKKYFTTFTTRGMNKMMEDQGIEPVRQWSGTGGTPNVEKYVPWYNVMWKVNK